MRQTFILFLYLFIFTESAFASSSDYEVNFRNCIKAMKVCDYNMLKAEDTELLKTISYNKNFKACLNNLSICKHELLTSEDKLLIINLKTKVELNSKVSQQKSKRVHNTCAENGSCYGEISDKTYRPKTVEVKGYYRKDGTYVRGHYRSKK